MFDPNAPVTATVIGVFDFYGNTKRFVSARVIEDRGADGVFVKMDDPVLAWPDRSLRFLLSREKVQARSVEPTGPVFAHPSALVRIG